MSRWGPAGEEVNWKDPVSVGHFLVDNALLEDAVLNDSATDSLAGKGLSLQSCRVISREDSAVAGWFLLDIVFKRVSEICETGPVETEQFIPDGTAAKHGEVIGVIRGSVSTILRGERLALNLLCRLSGIATHTRMFTMKVSATGTEILDTRKTTPCHRALERYAVRMGGGVNHRFDLAEMAMIKDNHIAAAGGMEALKKVTGRLREAGSSIEIEIDSLEQLPSVLELAPDRILLDNMTPVELKKAVEVASGSGCYMEASGGITIDNLLRTAETGVNGISSGALTHSAVWADIGFDWSSK